jgi:hypothetical protein
MRLHIALTALIALAVFPAAAHAGQVSSLGGTIGFAAAPG